MKILLINPSQEKVYGIKIAPAYPPLGILYIGTILKSEGHEVRLLDIDTEDINDAKFNHIFKDFDPGAIGITSVTPTFKNALKWARLSKELKEDIPIVLGGVHASIIPDDTIKHDEIDIAVVGEGELTAKELFNRLAEEHVSLEGIKGIYFKQKGKIVANDKRPLIDDLDSLPFPDRNLLRKPNTFMPPDATSLPVATIMTSRGCPGNCTFCCTKQVFSRKLRTRTVKNIVDEVENLIFTDGIREIHIADDTFTVIKKRVLEFCREIKQRKLNVNFQFMNGLRADFVDRDILKGLKDIGIKTVGYGVESGSETILKNIKKNIPLDVTRDAFKLSKELGFETWAFLIFGSPGETEDTIKETIRFTKELDPDFAKFFILKPFPGSEVYTDLQKNNLIFGSDYDDYGIYTKPVHKLPGLEPERILYWQKRAFREFYIRPRKIISHFRRIKSKQQFKLIINDLIFATYCMFKRNKR